MVTRSLFTGVSGLQSHLDKMGVISDNISNINTPGFKKSNMVFKSFLSQQISSATRPTETEGGQNPQAIGLGVQIGSVNLDMGQGQLQRTGVNTDLSLQGDGFFTVRESGSQNNLYTRAGSFQFDAEGRMVDPSTGNIVQGYNAPVEDGAIGELVAQGSPEDVQVTEGMQSIPGQATTFQNLSGNLDANGEVGIDPVSVGFENSEIRYEFERYHPTKNLYRFSAVWTQNPPSGKQIGDAVKDQVTGRDLEGIMELNDEGQVRGIFRNPDTNGNNGAEQVQAARTNGSSYTLDPEALEVRDQFDLFSDIKDQDFNGEMRLQFGTAGGQSVNNPFNANGSSTLPSDNQYVIQWQDINGQWNNFVQEVGGGLQAAANISAGDGSFDVVNPGDIEIGDRLRVTDQSAGVSELVEVDGKPGGGTISISGTFSNAYTDDADTSITKPFTGIIGANERLIRDTSPATDGNNGNDRDGELEIGSNFASVSGAGTPTTGDQIFFSIAEADNTGILNQTGEEVKNEYRWAGTDGTFRVSTPESRTGNTSTTQLRRVFNYDETNLGQISNSTAFSDIANKEFTVAFSGASTYHVAADVNGTKGNTDSLTGGVVAGANTLGVNNTANFEIGDLLRIEEPSTGNQELLVVEDLPGGGNIEVATAPTANNTDATNSGTTFAYGAGSNLTNMGQVLTNQNGSISMSTGADERLFVDTDNTTDAGAGDNFANAPSTADTVEVGISISANDWSSATAAVNDEFTFTATSARSTGSNGRAFSIVKDGDGNDSALFAPNDDQPSNISFAPNLNDTSGILDLGPPFSNLLASSGTSATAEQKDPATIQVTASSDVFDSLGNQHTLSYQFEKTDDNAWMWHAQDPTPVDPDNPDIAGFGTVSFDENGQVLSSSTFASKTAEDLPPPGPQGDLERNQVYFNPPPETLQSDPSASDSLNPNVGAEPVAISPDFSNITQFAGENNVEVTDQDGVSQGQLASLSFNSQGILNGSYSNGESRELAQLSIAAFRNPAGLEKQGSTNFAESANSGLARPGTAGTGGRGTITPGALERSNVDLSAQFTTMISTQRGFQANTRTISTTDQMIQQVLALR